MVIYAKACIFIEWRFKYYEIKRFFDNIILCKKKSFQHKNWNF